MASDARTRRLLIAATAAIAAVALGGGWWAARLDRGEKQLRRGGDAELPPPVDARDSPTATLPAARERLAPPTNDGADGPAEGADLRPTGEVVGSVRRQRDGSAVLEGVVALAFVDLTDDRLRAAPWAGLTDDARAELHAFEETRIAADGTFRLRLPAPALVRRAAVRPALQRNQAPQFLELEQELADLPLAVDGTLELPLIVDDGAAIEGIVVTAEGGFPLRGARVAIPWWSDGNSDWACETDLDGRFRVAGIRREVAAARSNSEAVASCAGYRTRRFLVPPAGDDLDVAGLRLELERGVTVVIELVAPEGLPEEAAGEWRQMLLDVSATLQVQREATAPFETQPWLAVARFDRVGCRMEFAPIAPTRDAVVVVRGHAGRPLASIAVDASEERAPWRVTLAPPDEALDPVEPFDGNLPLFLELRRVDGTPFGPATVATRLARTDQEVEGRSIANEKGRVRVPRPQQGFALELRVAGYEPEWIVETALAASHAPRLSDRPPAPARPEPLLVTLRPLPPAR